MSDMDKILEDVSLPEKLIVKVDCVADNGMVIYMGFDARNIELDPHIAENVVIGHYVLKGSEADK